MLCCILCDVGVVQLNRSSLLAIHTTSIITCCIQEEDTRGGVQGTAGAADPDGSTTVATRHTPTRQVQPFQRQRPTRVDIKVPPIPARLGRNRRQRCVARDGQIPRQRDSRADHRAVLRQIEVPVRLRVGNRAVPVARR